MSVIDFSKRNKEMHHLRQKGMTYESIAKKYGLTTEQVRRIVLYEVFVEKPAVKVGILK